MIAFGVGVMKLSLDDVEWMTPAQFKACVDTWHEQRDREQLEAYKLSRFNAWLCLAPNLKENTSPEDLFRFEDEDKEIKIAKVTYGKTDAISKTKPPA